MKNITLFVTIALLFSSCGQFASLSANRTDPTASVTKTTTPISTSTLISSPAEVESTATVNSTSGLASDELRKYVGLTYPPLSNELTQGFGALVWNSDYAVTIVSDHLYTMLWLSKLTRLDESGNPVWEVKDIIELPKNREDVIFIPNGCLLNGELDNAILAIAKWDLEVLDSRFMTNEKILSAWRANTDLAIFQAMSTDGIECQADNAVEFT